MVTKIILANDTEINYAKQNGLNDSLNLSLIPMIKRITSKTRINLKNNSKKLINELKTTRIIIVLVGSELCLKLKN